MNDYKYYNNRTEMRWWYNSIADWLLANPGGSTTACAAALGRHKTTIGAIMHSDLFKSYYAERRKAWEVQHDFALIQKTTRIAHASLDLIAERLEKKRDAVPLNLLNDIAESSLARLGYGVEKSAVQVNNNFSQNNTTVLVPVSTAALSEARQALRLVEQRRAEGPLIEQKPEAEPDSSVEEGVYGASISYSA